MTNYKIDSIGWKKITGEDFDEETYEFYALVGSIDQPDYYFSLKLSFKKWLSYARKYHEILDDLYDENFRHGPSERDDAYCFSDIKSFGCNRRTLTLMIFEEIFDLEKEAKNAVALSTNELIKLNKFLRKVDRSKPLLKRKRVLYEEIYPIIPEAIYKELLLKYPILKSSKDFKGKVIHECNEYLDDFLVLNIAKFIRDLEKERDQTNC
jgi:hypothetical protein